MKTLAAAALALVATLGYAADISADQAKEHIGETATVCGKIAGTRYLDQSGITFLNFEKPYPDSPFTAVIRDEYRAKFGKPEEAYREKSLCVSGKIEEYNKRPQIVLTDPAQVKVK